MKDNYEAFFIFLYLYNLPSRAQLVERRTVVVPLANILRSLFQIWLGGQHFCKKIINKRNIAVKHKAVA